MQITFRDAGPEGSIEIDGFLSGRDEARRLIRLLDAWFPQPSLGFDFLQSELLKSQADLEKDLG